MRPGRRVKRRVVVAGAGISIAASAVGALAWAPDDAPVARGGHGPVARRALAAPAPARPPRAPAMQTISPAAPPLPSIQLGALDRALDEATDLLDQLRIIDRALATVNAEQVMSAIVARLDRPATTEEARTLRLALLNRLGVYKHFPRAEARLIAATASDRPPSERVVAIESLRRDGTLSPAARARVEQLASDPDESVRERARAALSG